MSGTCTSELLTPRSRTHIAEATAITAKKIIQPRI